MTAPAIDTVAYHLCAWVEARSLAEIPDRQLLERFVRQRDEAAFAALLRRHGPMVLQVCCRVLGRHHDAEDVFQATFLLLARKAKSIRKGDSVGSWLHGVAYRLAVRSQEQTRRRQARERRAADMRRAEPSREAAWRELQAVLDEELQRLPAKYRDVLVLCYLEGQTQEEAAHRLGCPLGTVRSRLARARSLFQKRLLRRGLALSAATMATALVANGASAATPAALLRSTLKAALTFAAGPAREGISPSAILLVEKGLHAMFAAKLKRALTVVLAMTAFTAGAGTVTVHVLADKFAQTKPEGGPQIAAKTPDNPKAAEKVPTVRQGDALPAGVLRRLGSLRFRHDHGGTAWLPTAFSHDGKMLATCCGSVRLWDTATGELLRKIEGRFPLRPPLFSPDGKVLAVQEERDAVCLLEVSSGKVLRRLPAENLLCAFSPDGKRLVTSQGKRNSVHLWDAKSGETIAVLPDHPGFVHSAAFTADGRTLVAACWNNSICRWDVDKRELRKTVRLPLPEGRQACLSLDGRTLAVTPRDDTAVSLWDTETGERRCTLQGERNTAQYGLAFSPDGTTLATDGPGPGLDKATISLWDAKTGKALRRIAAPLSSVFVLQFAPDGRTLLSSGMEPCVRLWDVQTGKERFEEAGHRGAIESLAFAPDGRTLVSGSWDGRLRVWDVAAGRTRRALTDHGGRVHALAVTPDGKTVLSAGLDHCLRLHDLATGKERHCLSLDKPEKKPHEPGYQFVSFGFSLDGRTLATWSTRRQDGVFHVWDLGIGERGRVSAPRETLGALTRPRSPLCRCWFSPDARFVLRCDPAPMGDGGGMSGGGPSDETGTPPWMKLDPSSLVLQDVATGRRVLALPQPDAFQSVHAFAPDGRTLVTATGRIRGFEGAPSDKHALHLWELASGKERLTIAPGKTGGEYRFEHVAVAPDGRMLATVRADRTIQFWDMETGAELLSRRGPSSPVRRLAFSPDSRLLATGHDDSTILLWDATAGRRALRNRAEKLESEQLERLWIDLAGADARKAYAAIGGLSAAPEQALPLLRDRLRPAIAVPADKLRKLIEELDSDAFSRREAASVQLAALGEQTHTALRTALKAKPSVERRRRIEALLADSCRVKSAEVLRSLRGVEVLEHIGGAKAYRVLEALAAGASDARLTCEARAALARWQKKVNRRAFRQPSPRFGEVGRLGQQRPPVRRRLTHAAHLSVDEGKVVACHRSALAGGSVAVVSLQ